jgi:hypothetical protein
LRKPRNEVSDDRIQFSANGGIGDAKFFFHVLDVAAAFDEHLHKIKIVSGRRQNSHGWKSPSIAVAHFGQPSFVMESLSPHTGHLPGALYFIVSPSESIFYGLNIHPRINNVNIKIKKINI